MIRQNRMSVTCHGIAAGAAGGFAEIIWVSTYAVATGTNAASLARGVTTAAGLGALLPTASVALGILIHMVLALVLGIALAFVWHTFSRSWLGRAGPYAFALTALTAVWATNFFVILPLMSPDFVHLVPYPVSLLSKLLFGLAAAAVLRYAPVQRAVCNAEMSTRKST